MMPASASQPTMAGFDARNVNPGRMLSLPGRVTFSMAFFFAMKSSIK